MASLLEQLGVGKMPWVIRAYFFLTIVLVALLLVAVNSGPDNTLGASLFSLATDLLKLVIGALLGSLSMAARRMEG